MHTCKIKQRSRYGAVRAIPGAAVCILILIATATSALAQSAPSVDNASGPTSSAATRATLYGQVTATNGAALDAVRIYFGDDNGGATHNWDVTNTIDETAVTEGVPFSTNMTGLLYGKMYYYTVYASNSFGEAGFSGIV